MDHQYIHLVSSRLELFKRKNQNLYNFRCPVCGDSAKSKIKARGYFYRKSNAMFFRCHNCNESMSLGSFVKLVDPNLYEQYIFDRYKNGENGHSNYEKPSFSEFDFKPHFTNQESDAILSSYPRIDSLPDEHFAKRYVIDRQIPEEYHKELWFVSDFKVLVDKLEPDNQYSLKENDARLVIPFKDKKGSLIALQGRTLTNSYIRYITIKVDKDAPKIFGLDRVDPNKCIYVVEGPIDSMFLDNSIAVGGASISAKDLHNIGDDMVRVFDNECRNKAIVEEMVKLTEDEDDWICVWPDSTAVKEDINDLILKGMTSEEIQ